MGSWSFEKTEGKDVVKNLFVNCWSSLAKGGAFQHGYTLGDRTVAAVGQEKSGVAVVCGATEDNMLAVDITNI